MAIKLTSKFMLFVLLITIVRTISFVSIKHVRIKFLMMQSFDTVLKQLQ